MVLSFLAHLSPAPPRLRLPTYLAYPASTLPSTNPLYLPIFPIYLVPTCLPTCLYLPLLFYTNLSLPTLNRTHTNPPPTYDDVTCSPPPTLHPANNQPTCALQTHLLHRHCESVRLPSSACLSACLPACQCVSVPVDPAAARLSSPSSLSLQKP